MYAQVGNDAYKLLTRDELVEWAQELDKFEGRDFLGMLTLMVHFNLFDEYLEENPYAEKLYMDFLNEKKPFTKH